MKMAPNYDIKAKIRSNPYGVNSAIKLDINSARNKSNICFIYFRRQA